MTHLLTSLTFEASRLWDGVRQLDEATAACLRAELDRLEDQGRSGVLERIVRHALNAREETR